MPEQSLNLGSKKIRNLPIPKECFIGLGGWLGYELWQQASVGMIAVLFKFLYDSIIFVKTGSTLQKNH
jgi:hypothetical protein